MELHMVLLSTILAFALASTEQSVSSPTTTTTTSSTIPNPCPHSDTSMSGAIKPSITTTTSSTATPKSCPHSGYQLYPEFNCYKRFREYKTWSEARDQCMADGGDLMVMETEREIEDVYLPLYDSADFYFNPWMGVYKPEGEDGWMSVNGEPALSTWWRSGEPDGDADRKCAFTDFDGLLRNYNCTYTAPFICEISL